MNAAALVVGGFLGTLLRYAAGEAVPPLPGGFPLAILGINLVGCFALGWLFTAVPGRLRIRPEIRLGLGTGVAGAFTTFSTFSVQSVDLLLTGRYFTAAAYILLSLLGGLALTYAGVCLAGSQREEGRP